VLGVGLGTPPEDEYGSFGEPVDPVVRAAMRRRGAGAAARRRSRRAAGGRPRASSRRRALRGDARRRDARRRPGGRPCGGRAAGPGGHDLVDGVAGATQRRPGGAADQGPAGPAR
jgi:hypothetical protein